MIRTVTTTAPFPEGQFDRMLRFYRVISDQSASKIVTASWWDSQARIEYTGRRAHLPEQIGHLVSYLADFPETESYQLDAIR